MHNTIHILIQFNTYCSMICRLHSIDSNYEQFFVKVVITRVFLLLLRFWHACDVRVRRFDSLNHYEKHLIRLTKDASHFGGRVLFKTSIRYKIDCYFSWCEKYCSIFLIWKYFINWDCDTQHKKLRFSITTCLWPNPCLLWTDSRWSRERMRRASDTHTLLTLARNNVQ